MALVGLTVSLRTPHVKLTSDAVTTGVTRAPGAWIVYVVIALSGLNALGAEVIWTRLLSLMLGATVYTFSIILAVFLTGLGIGSSLGAAISRSIPRPKLALGVCQLLLAGAIGWTAYAVTRSLPYWPIDPGIAANPWLQFQLDPMRCVSAVLPPAILWGASFPLALASVASPGQDPGRLVGGVYAANTVGAIVGAIAFSMLAIPALGTQNAQRILIGMSGLSSLLMFTLVLRPRRMNMLSGRTTGSMALRWVSVVLVIASMGGVAAVTCSVAKVPWGLIAYGRYLPTFKPRSGESMFSRRADASKVALVWLAQRCAEHGIALIDCQLPSAHLRRLGSRPMPRREFLEFLPGD